LRKTFLVATVAAFTLGAAGIAHAQTPAPAIDATVSVSPSKAGTKSKPKNERFKLTVKNNTESRTTASGVEVTLPSTLKLSLRGLDQCEASDDELIANINECRSSIAGSGEANAVVNPFAPAPAPLKFKVTPVVGDNNELLFVLDSPIADAVLHGKIKGRKMTIAITPELQQPAPGTYSALVDLTATLSKKKGKNSLFTSNGCKSRAHKVGVRVTYVPNPNPPAATSASDTAEARCS
jgi:hypothetical protein